MSLLIGTGISTKLDSFSAGKEAALNSHSQIQKREPDIVITFISTIFDEKEVLKGIRSVFPTTRIIGCSSPATISSYGSITNSVSVYTMFSEFIGISCGISDSLNKNSRNASHKAATQASFAAKFAKQLYLTFYDGLSGNSIDILRGAQEILGTGFPIIGGSSIDNINFQESHQYLNTDVYSNSIIGLLISGDVNVGIGKGSGWNAIGKPHKITKAYKNIIKEIDNKIAVELYEEYFDKPFEELNKEGICKLGSAYPIGIIKKGYNIIRIPIKIDDSGGLVLSAEIPEGESISLMLGDKDSILESVKTACDEAIKTIKNKKIRLAIVLSDIARLGILKKDAQKEVDIISDMIGKNVPILGCYTLGGYIPLYTSEDKLQYVFNNQNISVTLLTE